MHFEACFLIMANEAWQILFKIYALIERGLQCLQNAYHDNSFKMYVGKVIEKQLTGTGAIKIQNPPLKPKREINKYYK